MSLHAELSPEVQERLKKQQRNNTISSIFISLLMVVLVALLLFYVLLPPVDNREPEIISYSAPIDEAQKVEKVKPVRSMDKKPTPPAAASKSMAKVISSSTFSNIAIATPDEVMMEDSMDFGDAMAFDDGWGDEDSVVGTTTFFGEEVSGERILYVIDYSASMRKLNREELMREELADSLKKLPGSMKYQMIFFAGDAWVAGADIVTYTLNNGQPWLKGYINEKGKEVTVGKNKDVWKPEWRTVSAKSIKKSVKVVEDTQLLYGTRWDAPLDMAFEMKPLPDTIIFMTDGITGANPVELAEEYAKLAKRKGIVINTVALMEPRAAEAMAKLGEGTGGTFSLINGKGEKENLTKKKK